MPSQIGQRLAFQNASNAVKRAGLNPSRAVLSQSYLRLETPISATATSYKFDVLTTENTQPATYPTQLKLALQDAFVISTLFIGIYAPNGAATADTNTTPLSYPTIGNNGGAAGNCVLADAQKLMGIYNGFLQLNVNQRTIMTGWDLYRHLRIPSTQANGVLSTQFSNSTTTPTVAAFTAPTHIPYDSTDGSSDGFYPVEPNVVLDGSKKNDLTITLPNAIGAFTSGYNYRFCIIARGILAQNVSAVN